MKIQFAALFLVIVIFMSSIAMADELSALVIEAKGKVAFQKPGTTVYPAVQVSNTRLSSGDMIFTGPDSSATLLIEGKMGDANPQHPANTTVQIGPRARVQLSKLFSDVASGGGENVQIKVAEGQVLSNVRRIDPNSERFEVQTPTAVAAVRGTKFLASVKYINRKPEVTFRVDRGMVDILSYSGKRLANLREGDTLDIAPDMTIQQGTSSVGSAPGGQGVNVGARPSTGQVGTGGISGEGAADSDTFSSPANADQDEDDDIGGNSPR